METESSTRKGEKIHGGVNEWVKYNVTDAMDGC